MALTQSELSHLSGISIPLIQKLEAGEGNPSIDTLEKLGEVLGFSLEVGIKGADWDLLAVAGVPVSRCRPSIKKIRFHEFLREFKKAWNENLDVRQKECLLAVLLALKIHYPKYYDRYFSDLNLDRSPENLTGREIKLVKMALSGISKFL
ncbi:MAG: helix-turn-helix transcriptional regulator [Oligoflexales bacterium]|nr:helix-turn-helix transcriptional regulator [Oligoflexales bacterium]